MSLKPKMKVIKTTIKCIGVDMATSEDGIRPSLTSYLVDTEYRALFKSSS